LTSWNAGEDFASLGSAFHLVCGRRRGPFEESFPPLASFLASHARKSPIGCVARARGNRTRNFQGDLHSTRMNELRDLLAGRFVCRAAFLPNAWSLRCPRCFGPRLRGPGKCARAVSAARRDWRRYFCIIDYVNFKGEGRSRKSVTRERGGIASGAVWHERGGPGGLRNLAECRAVLERRVQNSPPARNEPAGCLGEKPRSQLRGVRVPRER
jgi:hypothetical protein